MAEWGMGKHYAPEPQELAEGIPAYQMPDNTTGWAKETTTAPEEHEKIEDQFHGCTMRRRSEGGGYEILSPDKTVLVECDDQWVYTRTIDGETKNFIPAGDILRYRVLARCQHLVYAKDDGVLFSKLYEGDAAYVGYSADMNGPVFATADTDGDKHMDDWDFRGLILETGASERVTEMIPHYAMASKLNVKYIKGLLHAESLSAVYRGRAGRQSYRENAKELIKNLAVGGALWSTSHCASNTAADEISSDSVMLGAGFVYQVPYTGALAYPEELVRIFQEFAKKHPEDLLPLRVMILACHLWVDIVRDENLCLEESEEKKRKEGKGFKPVPHVSLAMFLLYFAHWLRWTENMGLIQYIHPFRFINAAWLSDSAEEGISVDSGCIDEERVLTLMSQITSKIESLEPGQRVDIYPNVLFGSLLPTICSSKRIRYPNEIQLCLTGLVNVNHYGLDSYARLSGPEKDGPQWTDMRGKYREILLPKHVEAGLFKPMGTSVDMEDLAELPKVWWEEGSFAPHFKTNPSLLQEVSPAPTKLKLPKIWGMSLADFLPSHTHKLFVEMAQYHYDRMVSQGYVAVLGDAKLTVDDNLMWMPRGMKRMAAEELEKRPRKMIRGPNASRSPSPIRPEYKFGEDVPMLAPGKKIIPDYPEYEDLVKTWSEVPDGAHWAWKAGLEEVKALEEGNRSEATLRELVTKASVAEMDDWRMVRQKMKQVLERDAVLPIREVEIDLPLAFGRILGIRPPEDLVANIWPDCLKKQAMDINREAVRRIISILNFFGNGGRNNDFMKEELQEFHDLAKVSTKWLGKWVEFIEEDIYSAD